MHMEGAIFHDIFQLVRTFSAFESRGDFNFVAHSHTKWIFKYARSRGVSGVIVLQFQFQTL